MNKYEVTVVLDGKASAKKKKVTESLEKTIAALKGKVVKSEDWGVKEMAYKVAKSDTGLYLYFEIELDPSGVKALNDKLKNDADIIRFLVVRI